MQRNVVEEAVEKTSEVEMKEFRAVVKGNHLITFTERSMNLCSFIV